MINPRVILRRHPYEEPYHLHLEWQVTNGDFAACIDTYANADDLIAIGQGLLNFPSRVPDEFSYEYGSENPQARFYRYFLMRAYTVGNRGHCGLQFVLNLNQAEPEEGKCTFSIQTEPASLNRLGELFLRFRELGHLELRWGSEEASLNETHQL